MHAASSWGVASREEAEQMDLDARIVDMKIKAARRKARKAEKTDKRRKPRWDPRVRATDVVPPEEYLRMVRDAKEVDEQMRVARISAHFAQEK